MCLRRRIRVAVSKVGGLDRMVVQAGKGKRRHFMYLKSLTTVENIFNQVLIKITLTSSS